MKSNWYLNLFFKLKSKFFNVLMLPLEERSWFQSSGLDEDTIYVSENDASIFFLGIR